MCTVLARSWSPGRRIRSKHTTYRCLGNDNTCHLEVKVKGATLLVLVYYFKKQVHVRLSSAVISSARHASGNIGPEYHVTSPRGCAVRAVQVLLYSINIFIQCTCYCMLVTSTFEVLQRTKMIALTVSIMVQSLTLRLSPVPLQYL